MKNALWPSCNCFYIKNGLSFNFLLLWINHWYWVIPMFGQHKQTNKQKFPMKKPLALNNNLYEGKIKHLKKSQRFNSEQWVSLILFPWSQTSNLWKLKKLWHGVENFEFPPYFWGEQEGRYVSVTTEKLKWLESFLAHPEKISQDVWQKIFSFSTSFPCLSVQSIYYCTQTCKIINRDLMNLFICSVYVSSFVCEVGKMSLWILCSCGPYKFFQ